jgi:hypothetical protein
MRTFSPVLMASLLVALVGCEEQSQPSSGLKSPPTKAEYQRFLPIPPSSGIGVPWHGFFALDTKTGKLCMTTTRKFSDASEWVNEVPLCQDLDLPEKVDK